MGWFLVGGFLFFLGLGHPRGGDGVLVGAKAEVVGGVLPWVGPPGPEVFLWFFVDLVELVWESRGVGSVFRPEDVPKRRLPGFLFFWWCGGLSSLMGRVAGW